MKTKERGGKKRKRDDQSGKLAKAQRTGSGKGKRGGKRSAIELEPEEDPLIAAEDAEIKRLGKLLGITSSKGKGKGKGKGKLEKELEKDGLGGDFVDFLDGLDEIGDYISGKLQGGSVAPEAGEQSDSGSNASYGDQDLAIEADYADLPTDIDSEEEELRRYDGSEEEGSESNESAERDEGAHYHATPGQDIYGRALEGGADEATSEKYVPPAMRGHDASTASGKKMTDDGLRRLLKGALNRMSESNLDPVMKQLRELYRQHSTSRVNSLLLEETVAVCVHHSQVMKSLIPPYSALIASLHVVIESDVGAFFLESIARKFKDAVEERLRAPSSNLLLLLGHLYTMGVLHCTLMYDIVRMLLEGFGDLEVELLLLLLQQSGFQLKADDPSALKEIAALASQKAAQHSSVTNTPLESQSHSHTSLMSGLTSLTGLTGTPQVSSDQELSKRGRYLTEMIVDLRNKKRNQLQNQALERIKRLRKWLGHVKSGSGSGRGSSDGMRGEALRISWNDLISSETKGRWWKVGASWAGRESRRCVWPKGEKIVDLSCFGSETATVKAGGRQSIDNEDQLMQLASAQRMNTDIRRSAFCVLMSSADFENAFERLIKLNLTEKQAREVPRVVIECCGKERAYNPFYAHLSARLCEHDASNRFTFQLTFWDTFKQFETLSPRHLSNVARLMAHMVLTRHLSLGMLKAVEIEDLVPSATLYLKVFFLAIFAEEDDATFLDVFQRLAQQQRQQQGDGRGSALTGDSVLLFLKLHMEQPPQDWAKDRRKIYRKRLKAIRKMLG
ncbi:unnamed protein product [Chrysoparadoxa australica]